MLINLAVAVVAVTMVVLAAFMIPAFIEIRKTAIALRQTSERAESEFKPVLHELHKTLTELKCLVGGAAARTEDVVSFMEALGDTGRNLRTINHVVGAVAGVLASSSAWMTGARVAGKVILERLLQRRKEA